MAVPCAVVAVFLMAIGPFPPPAIPLEGPKPLARDFKKGISYESWWHGEYVSPASDRTLSQLIAPLGVNWITLIIKCTQATRTSTAIACDTNTITASDDEIAHVVQYAHRLGLHVMLKPHIDLADHSVGREQINFAMDEAAWQQWFVSYTGFITHYAALAEKLKAEYFVVGTELAGTDDQVERWRAVIKSVRQIYHGPLTYAAIDLVEDQRISWWNLLDTIGVDAYFPLTLTTHPTLTQLKIGWIPWMMLLQSLSQRWNKPIIFTELGYKSVDGAARVPGFWWLDSPVDVQEQADCYQAVFEVFQSKPWWQGVFWWSWSVDPNQGGPQDKSYSIHNKPAEGILARYYGGRSDSVVISFPARAFPYFATL